MSEVERNRKRLVVNNSAYMFIEFPADHVFPSVRGLIFELMSAGILPIIAHPERNVVLAQKPELLYELVRMGALAQANRGSFLGFYGRMAADAAGRFLEYNLVHFIASDGHNTGSLAPILSDAVGRAEILVGSEGALALVEANPRAVLEDRELPYLPSPVDPRKSRKSFPLRVKGLFKGEGQGGRGSIDNPDENT
jgi:protein-tyrosine phosphatase